MRTQLKKRMLLFFASALVLSAALVLAFGFPKKSGPTLAADRAIFGTDTLHATYSLNEELTLPSAKVAVGGDELPAVRSALKYPDGRVYSRGAYSLSEPGRYTAMYYADNGGKTYLAETEFLVSDELFFVTGKNSSAAYGHDGKGNRDGIVAHIAPGDEFVFNSPIDVSENTADDVILGFYMLPAALGTADALAVRIRLTDAYDAENWIEVVTYANPFNAPERNDGKQPPVTVNMYSGARANGQELTGLRRSFGSSGGAIFYDYGTDYTGFEQTGYAYGFVEHPTASTERGHITQAFSFTAREGYGNLPYKMGLDYASKRVIGCTEVFSQYLGDMIIDLDEPLFFDDPWKGFTTGEAIVSLGFENYQSSDAGCVITRVNGEDLSAGGYLDRTKPVIDVETPTNIPKAIVGKPFRPYPATASDAVDGELECTVAAYINYNTGLPVRIAMENGAFVPKEEGEYQIVYSAVDRSGNRAEKVVEVTAKAESELSVTVDDGALGALGTLTSGTAILLPAPTVEGAEGEWSYRVIARHGEGKATYTVGSGEEWLPLYSGSYTLTYEVSDYIETKTVEKTVSVESGKAILPGTAEIASLLPPVFVKGVEYSFPSVAGTVVSSGAPVTENATLKYAFDGGADTDYGGGKVKIEAEETVTLKYTVGGETLSYSVPVADVGYEGKLDKKSYLYGFGDFKAASDENGSTYTITPEEESAKSGSLVYVKPVLVTNFTLNFTLSTDAFESITLRLVDPSDMTNILSVRLAPTDDGYRTVQVGDGKEYTVAESLADVNIYFGYSNHSGRVLVGDETTAYSTGDFGGFDSHLAYFRLDIEGAKEATAITVANINDTKLDDLDSDYAAPIYSYDMNSGTKTIGDEVTMARFTASDMFRFEASITVSVTDPDGLTVVSKDGVSLSDITDFGREYVFEIAKLGRYTVEIRVSDGKSGNDSLWLNINSTDAEKPTIALSSAATTAKVGKSVKIATATANDNSGSVTLTVMVLDPFERVVDVTDGAFTADRAGTYTVLYYAVDAAGNAAIASYRIAVAE